ncbi:MAG: hypothetical protein ABIJ50_13515 [Pseudomonadota bacterium]
MTRKASVGIFMGSDYASFVCGDTGPCPHRRHSEFTAVDFIRLSSE